MDVFYEQSVHKKTNLSDILKKMLIISSAVIIPLAFVLIGNISGHIYFYLIAFFVSLFCIYGVWFFWTSLYVDYEYSINKNLLTVSKIISNRRRKKMVSIDINNVISFNKYNQQALYNESFEHVYAAGSTQNGSDLYAAVFSKPGKGGKYLLIFSPNDRLLSSFKRFLRT